MIRSRPQNSKETLPRNKVKLGEELEKRLLGYAVGAGAVSAGLLALARPARAEIKFTPVNVTLQNGTLTIDLNHDGVVDFNIDDKTLTTSCCFYTQVLRVNGNGQLGASVVAHGGSALALQAGRLIGPGDPFRNVQTLSANMATAFNDSNSFFFIYGRFANTTHRFLGLRFQFDGQTHYGWAEFTFVQAGFNGSIPFVTARLLGYAYETVPDQPLRAGQGAAGEVGSRLNLPAGHTAPDAAATLQPATLGLLARGSSTLSAWRRKQVQ